MIKHKFQFTANFFSLLNYFKKCTSVDFKNTRPADWKLSWFEQTNALKILWMHVALKIIIVRQIQRRSRETMHILFDLIPMFIKWESSLYRLFAHHYSPVIAKMSSDFLCVVDTVSINAQEIKRIKCINMIRDLCVQQPYMKHHHEVRAQLVKRIHLFR